MLRLEGVLAVHPVIFGQRADDVGGEQDGAGHLVLVRPLVVEEAELGEDKPSLLPKLQSVTSLFVQPALEMEDCIKANIDIHVLINAQECAPTLRVTGASSDLLMARAGGEAMVRAPGLPLFRRPFLIGLIGLSR